MRSVRIILRTMTDKEIAFALGEHLLKAKFRVAAMTGELDHYRDAQGYPIAWRLHVDETIQQGLAHAFQERNEELHRVLDEANPEDLLRTLHTFLESL